MTSEIFLPVKLRTDHRGALFMARTDKRQYGVEEDGNDNR